MHVDIKKKKKKKKKKPFTSIANLSRRLTIRSTIQPCKREDRKLEMRGKEGQKEQRRRREGREKETSKESARARA